MVKLSLQTSEQSPIDRLLFISLQDQLSSLLRSSVTAQTIQQKQELSNQANSLRSNINSAQQQIDRLKAGDLSLRDQEDLIELLLKTLELERKSAGLLNSMIPLPETD
ncbi:hypothetical protein BY996DRAFT_6419896 [Phakopsora pachyrhizi]|nr:hypothetical protein BY996DRAFT_6419896 [Phakopsora pachyrhizi]